MSELLSRLVGVVLLRDGPQDIPAGVPALCASISLYVLATVLTFALGDAPARPMAFLMLAIGLPLILVRIVLGLKRLAGRWAQTATALFGAGALMSLLSLPMAAGGEQPGTVLALTGLLLFVWSFAVDAHIWRHALETTFAVGLAVAVVLFALSLSIITSITGPL